MIEVLAAVVAAMLVFGLTLALGACLGEWLRRPTPAELALFHQAIDRLGEMEQQRQSHERDLCQAVMLTLSGPPAGLADPAEDLPSWPENITPFRHTNRNGSDSATGS